MKRRSLLKRLAAAPAAVALPAAVPAPAQTSAASAPPDAFPKLSISSPEVAATGQRQFFSEQQLATLTKLCETLVPSFQGRPSAVDAGVPEFLDFFIAQSAPLTQKLYRDGLDQLAKTGVTDAALAPLRQRWTYEGPSDPYARFLMQAKSDVLQATMSSREWSASASRGRRAGATNYLWRTID
jgi:hypothetical protein